MMSLETINAMNNSNTVAAKKYDHIPYTVWPGDIENWKEGKKLPIPFPNIGDHIPKNFEPDGEPLFIDTSGFGANDELALSMSQMFDALEVGKAYAFIECGQFQAYLQPFTRKESAS